MTLDWTGFIILNALIICVYFVGKDAGADDERRRNARRRAHRLHTTNTQQQEIQQ